MRLAAAVALLAVPQLLLAQASRRSPAVPNGARVKIGDLEATVLAWRSDTVLVKAAQRSDTLRIARASIEKLRVLESPAVWGYHSRSKINFLWPADLSRPYDITSAVGDAYDHLLVVGTKTELAGVDPATGTVTWSRQDLANLDLARLDLVGRTGFALVMSGDTMTVIDLRTGLDRWNSTQLSFINAGVWVGSPNRDTAVIILGRTTASATTLMSIDVASGRIRWRQDSAASPEATVADVFVKYSPLADTDTTLVLYLNTAGPVRLDARTGRVLWRSTAVHGANAQVGTGRYAQLLAFRDLLFVPWEDSLVALRVNDGSRAWNARAGKNKLFRIQDTRAGLFIRGRDWFQLLDPATGTPVWAQPLQLKNAMWDIVSGDTAFVVGDKRAVAIDIRDGTTRTIIGVSFSDNEPPSGFTVWKKGLIVNSWHNLMLVDRKGRLQYHREYPSPKTSFGESLKHEVGSDVMRPTTVWSGSHIFFYTGEADALGHEGFSLVEVDPTTGSEAARLWFNGRVPTYTLDDRTATAYYRRDDTTIEALPFLDGRDLDFAVRNGHRALVERLIALGVNPTVPDQDGWTPLHYAALTGHTDVVQQLIRRGAKADERTRDGWMPWMMAFREQHDSLAQALRGSDTSALEMSIARAWRFGRQGRIPDAVAAVTQAAARDSLLGLWPSTWRMICWNGGANGQAGAVLSACDRAVDTTPADDDYRDGALLSRAVARALTGNLEGAIADLEATGVWPDDGTATSHWIVELRAGRNPFTPDLLARLRR